MITACDDMRLDGAPLYKTDGCLCCSAAIFTCCHVLRIVTNLLQFVYRLTKCPELSLGLFTLPVLEPEKPKPRPELVAHVIATRTKAPRVTDAAMSLPPNWETQGKNSDDCDELEPGHHEWGRTICVHSLAVVPEHQGKKIGSTLMKSYVQRIKEAEIADRIALLAHDDMIGFYENIGFENRGPSKCQFGGGGWSDMVCIPDTPYFSLQGCGD